MNFNINKLSKEDMFTLSKIDSVFSLSKNKNITKTTLFLDDKEMVFSEFLKNKYSQIETAYYGGYETAERKILTVFADYEDIENFSPPITPITISYRKNDIISHRDILGTIMSLKITRETIGDILIGNGKSVVFVADNIAPIILSEITKIKNIGVTLSYGIDDDFTYEKAFKDISGTVSSLRLDCTLSLIMNISREKASTIINQGLVQVNSFDILDRTFEINENDKLSIKKFGKVIISKIGNLTKKDRIHIECKKYI